MWHREQTIIDRTTWVVTLFAFNTLNRFPLFNSQLHTQQSVTATICGQQNSIAYAKEKKMSTPKDSRKRSRDTEEEDQRISQLKMNVMETTDASVSAERLKTETTPRGEPCASAKEARFEGRRMPETFHQLLYNAVPPSGTIAPASDATMAGPDEAPDVEDLIKGHEDYSDLPEERRQALRAAITQLCQRVAAGPRGQSRQPPHRDAATGASPAPCSPERCSSSNSSWTPAELEHLRVRAARLKGFKDTARKSELTAAYRELVVEEMLVRKKGKSHSGVLVITVLMGPGAFSCPKDCHYCPNQPGVARSYLLKEPAVLRGFRNGWDPVAQFYDRASALEGNGHVVDKIELIILGGTFSFYPAEYAEQFINGCFYAANTYYSACGGPPRAIRDMASELEENEHSKCRIIGVTVETRPDYINLRELRRFRHMGVTRVQLGIQHLDDEILRIINRDCPTKKTVQAIRLLLNAGFKVDAHWMPDLPGSSYEKDLEMFQVLLDDELNESFQVDQWKVYPTATVPYTKISEWYEQGVYKPYAELDGGAWMAKLLLFIVTHAPYRLRLNRIVRDIPTTYIQGGERRVNLRQLLEAEMKRNGLRCNDIRERECKRSEVREEELEMYVDQHRASGGTEYYISMENRDRTQLYGHLRLRIRDGVDHHRQSLVTPVIPAGEDSDVMKEDEDLFPVLRNAALIREVHTYGTLLAVHPQSPAVVPSRERESAKAVGDAAATHDMTSSGTSEMPTAREEAIPPPTEVPIQPSVRPAATAAQHRGIGSRLMRKAEEIAWEQHGLTRCVVIAGIGARAYYARLGYSKCDTYMVKELSGVTAAPLSQSAWTSGENRRDDDDDDDRSKRAPETGVGGFLRRIGAALFKPRSRTPPPSAKKEHLTQPKKTPSRLKNKRHLQSRTADNLMRPPPPLCFPSVTHWKGSFIENVCLRGVAKRTDSPTFSWRQKKRNCGVYHYFDKGWLTRFCANNNNNNNQTTKQPLTTLCRPRSNIVLPLYGLLLLLLVGPLAPLPSRGADDTCYQTYSYLKWWFNAQGGTWYNAANQQVFYNYAMNAVLGLYVKQLPHPITETTDESPYVWNAPYGITYVISARYKPDDKTLLMVIGTTMYDVIWQDLEPDSKLLQYIPKDDYVNMAPWAFGEKNRWNKIQYFAKAEEFMEAAQSVRYAVNVLRAKRIAINGNGVVPDNRYTWQNLDISPRQFNIFTHFEAINYTLTMSEAQCYYLETDAAVPVLGVVLSYASSGLSGFTMTEEYTTKVAGTLTVPQRVTSGVANASLEFDLRTLSLDSGSEDAAAVSTYLATYPDKIVFGAASSAVNLSAVLQVGVLSTEWNVAEYDALSLHVTPGETATLYHIIGLAVQSGAGGPAEAYRYCVPITFKMADGSALPSAATASQDLYHCASDATSVNGDGYATEHLTFVLRSSGGSASAWATFLRRYPKAVLIMYFYWLPYSGPPPPSCETPVTCAAISFEKLVIAAHQRDFSADRNVRRKCERIVRDVFEELDMYEAENTGACLVGVTDCVLSAVRCCVEVQRRICEAKLVDGRCGVDAGLCTGLLEASAAPHGRSFYRGPSLSTAKQMALQVADACTLASLSTWYAVSELESEQIDVRGPYYRCLCESITHKDAAFRFFSLEMYALMSVTKCISGQNAVPSDCNTIVVMNPYSVLAGCLSVLSAADRIPFLIRLVHSFGIRAPFREAALSDEEYCDELLYSYLDVQAVDLHPSSSSLLAIRSYDSAIKQKTTKKEMGGGLTTSRPPFCPKTTLSIAI
eukprot:gene9765-6848_t